MYDRAQERVNIEVDTGPEQRQLKCDQFKVVDLPGPLEDSQYKEVTELPQLAIPDVGYPPVGEEPVNDTASQQDEEVPEVWDEPVTDAPCAEAQELEPVPEGRYGLRPVAVRRALAAEERQLHANKRRAGTARS